MLPVVPSGSAIVNVRQPVRIECGPHDRRSLVRALKRNNPFLL